MQEKVKTNHSPIILIILCFLVYVLAYLGRYSYSSNINSIMGYYNVNRESAGLVGTFFFISYGIGQVVHGLLCKKYNPKYSVSIALAVSSLMNLLIGITDENNFQFLKFYWLINGFVQSILWSSLIRLLNEHLPKKNLNTAIFMMALPASVGTFLVYGLSSLISALEIKFKVLFIIGFVVLLLVSIIWFVVVDKLKKSCLELKEEQIEEKEELGTSKMAKGFVLVFSILAIFAISNNLVKDGLTTWMPTILKEKYDLSNSISTFLTVFLPLFAVFGSTAAIFLNKKLKNFIYVCGVLYLIAFVMFLCVILLLNSSVWILPLGCFMIVTCAMGGVNNVLTNIFPMLYSKKNAGLIAGVLDGFCYVGSAITAFGLGSVADNFGWNHVFYILISVCLLMIIICLIYIIVQKINKRSVDKNI